MIGLGSWRFFLAFLVAISHLYAHMIDGPAAYAVWGFFVMSGYLMTYVLTEKYGSNPLGLRAYAYNRFLRIYPLYFISVFIGLFTIGVLSRYGLSPTGLNPQFQKPVSPNNWLTVFIMNPFGDASGLPVPVAGALYVEVIAYMIMPFMAQGKNGAWVALFLSIASNIGYGFTTESFPIRYTLLAPCMLAFSAGSLLCHYRDKLSWSKNRVLSLLAWSFHGIYWLADPSWPWGYGIILSVPLSMWVVLSFSDVKAGKLDTLLGDLSYPMYLLHTTVAAWLIPRFGFDRGLLFFIISFVLTMGVSWIMLILVDAPIKRKKILLEPVHHK